MEVFRIYGIFLVLLVRVGNIADKDKRSLLLRAVMPALACGSGRRIYSKAREFGIIYSKIFEA